MAKLTRTQKYASLRDELANNKETATTSQDLTGFEQRLQNVQENLAPEKPVVETSTDPAYTWQPFEPKQEEAADNSWQSIVEEPKVEEKPAEFSGSTYFDSFVNTPSVDNSKKEETDFNSLFEVDDKNETNVNDIYTEVFNDIKDTTDDTISRKERDTYLNQTMSDVNVHNMMNGEESLDQIINNAVNEVRHTEVEPAINEADPVDNTYAWAPFTEEKPKVLDADEKVEPVVADKVGDENFSNTVTVEISKIMDQMASAPKQEEVKVEAPAEVKVEAPVIEPAVVEEKAEDIVEIKNINELKDEPLKNTVSGTIPFVVSTNEDEEVEEDDEEEGSNTVLNVILIVLIIVLIAVLGLIIFYILKTKGIF